MWLSLTHIVVQRILIQLENNKGRDKQKQQKDSFLILHLLKNELRKRPLIGPLNYFW
jgi:hypothetical protein